jgi:hypothetical protein
MTALENIDQVFNYSTIIFFAFCMILLIISSMALGEASEGFSFMDDMKTTMKNVFSGEDKKDEDEKEKEDVQENFASEGSSNKGKIGWIIALLVIMMACIIALWSVNYAYSTLPAGEAMKAIWFPPHAHGAVAAPIAVASAPVSAFGR